MRERSECTEYGRQYWQRTLRQLRFGGFARDTIRSDLHGCVGPFCGSTSIRQQALPEERLFDPARKKFNRHAIVLMRSVTGPLLTEALLIAAPLFTQRNRRT
jgi:hypothetical protein